MRLATIRTKSGTRAARLDASVLTPLAASDVGRLLASPIGDASWEPAEEPVPLSEAEFAPLVPRPEKIVCVGLNYRSHILELGLELPEHPTVFAKFSTALLGPYDDLVLPRSSSSPDWEVELAVVVGAPVRRANEREARGAIAGYTVANDVTMRDWQWRTTQWLQGKSFDRSTPLGPFLVTGDEIDQASDLVLECSVDDHVMQRGSTSDLVFSPAAIVSYVSQFTTLVPGDVLLTGTPEGVGDARSPKLRLHEGQLLTTTVQELGTCRNLCVDESLDPTAAPR